MRRSRRENPVETDEWVARRGNDGRDPREEFHRRHEGTSKPSLKNGWHRGAARLALSTGAPLVPVRLTGTRRLPLPTRVRIAIGEPIVVPAQRPTIAAARALTERLERAVAGAGAE